MNICLINRLRCSRERALLSLPALRARIPRGKIGFVTDSVLVYHSASIRIGRMQAFDAFDKHSNALHLDHYIKHISCIFSCQKWTQPVSEPSVQLQGGGDLPFATFDILPAAVTLRDVACSLGRNEGQGRKRSRRAVGNFLSVSKTMVFDPCVRGLPNDPVVQTAQVAADDELLITFFVPGVGLSSQRRKTGMLASAPRSGLQLCKRVGFLGC